jgi:uncharacterized membrane protein YccF (DUF307 family)
MSEAVVVHKAERRVEEIPFIIRVIWFFVVGLEFTAVWIFFAWLLNASIIGLPLGLWMIDRVPQVLTLKARSGAWVVTTKQGERYYQAEKQMSWLIRGLYFVVFGWWLSLFWALGAYLFCASIIGLPIGVVMLHSLPAITTLQRG